MCRWFVTSKCDRLPIQAFRCVVSEVQTLDRCQLTVGEHRAQSGEISAKPSLSVRCLFMFLLIVRFPPCFSHFPFSFLLALSPVLFPPLSPSLLSPSPSPFPFSPFSFLPLLFPSPSRIRSSTPFSPPFLLSLAFLPFPLFLLSIPSPLSPLILCHLLPSTVCHMSRPNEVAGSCRHAAFTQQKWPHTLTCSQFITKRNTFSKRKRKILEQASPQLRSSLCPRARASITHLGAPCASSCSSTPPSFRIVSSVWTAWSPSLNPLW